MKNIILLSCQAAYISISFAIFNYFFAYPRPLSISATCIICLLQSFLFMTAYGYFKHHFIHTRFFKSKASFYSCNALYNGLSGLFASGIHIFYAVNAIMIHPNATWSGELRVLLIYDIIIYSAGCFLLGAIIGWVTGPLTLSFSPKFTNQMRTLKIHRFRPETGEYGRCHDAHKIEPHETPGLNS